MGKQVVETPAWIAKEKTWNRDVTGNLTVAYKRSSELAPWVDDGTFYGQTSSDNGYVKGVQLPGFHKVKRSGVLLPHTKYSKAEISGSLMKSEWIIQANVNGDTTGNKYAPWTGWYLGHAPSLEEVMELCALDTGLIQRAAAKVYSKGFDVSTFLAELGPTLRMFADLVTKVRNIRRLRYTHGMRNSSNSEDLTNWWLEARYGWRPLIADMKNLQEALRDWTVEKRRVKERSRYQHEYVSSTFHEVPYYFGTVFFTYTDTVWRSKHGAVSADVNYTPVNISLMMTAWELIPYSFVVDWLIQVGQLISSLCFEDISISVTSSAGAAARIRRTVTSNFVEFQTGYSGSIDYKAMYETYFEHRVPYPVPQKPQNRIKLDFYKVIDSILLLKQLKR